ncbi:MmgE/PrpD family protein [Mesorhizobium sp. NZP2077]|uniref:MmgE/PrpD family protein n=1 Tax=Mesorhizobium sp. NZP2077 TaxID=2483404 RepID=UPI001555ADC6|nr:MmgE/PrpD family protein [Mesorhizobium sp. NZP2077]QKD20531.1 MmgE/PrpD family protein [Mesorhizobium sp. NZP2077]
MSTTRTLAEYICTSNAATLPADSLEMAANCILDALTAAVAGHEEPSVVSTRTATRSLYGAGQVPVWFTGTSSTAAGAILSNSSAASVLDLDDGHWEARGHPGAAVIPTILAVAAETGVSAEELLIAIVLGYEVGVRIKSARTHGPSGVWTGFAVAAAAGKLRRLTPAALSNAIALAGGFSPNLIVGDYTAFSGSDIKEGIPWSATTAYQALLLAEHGFTACEDIFDHKAYYDAERILAGLGQEAPRICETYFKPYAVCRHIHGPLRALEKLIMDHELRPDTIEKIDVHTFDFALALPNKTKPETLTDIQYSIPYSLAIASICGGNALLPIDASLLNRADISELAERITVRPDPEFSRLFPRSRLARVEITSGGRKISSPVTEPHGGPTSPMSLQELEEKFRFATRRLMSRDAQQQVIDAVSQLRRGDSGPLLTLLRCEMLPAAAV